MATIRLGVPCTVLPVRVTLGYGAYLSPIEHSVLTAIALGPPDAAPSQDECPAGYGIVQLTRRFGLGERLMFNLISDLWHKNYILVEINDGLVWASEEVIERVRLGTLDTMAGGETVLAERQLLVDGLTGRLLPISGSPQRRGNDLAVPVDRIAEPAKSFTQPELLKALNESLHIEQHVRDPREREQGRVPQILTAQIAPSVHLQPPLPQWRSVNVQVGWDADAERLMLQILDDHLPVAARQEAAVRISEIVERFPDTVFARRLKKAIDEEYSGAKTLEEAVGEFTETAAALSAALPGTRVARHGGLCRDADRILQLFQSRTDSEVGAEVVVDAPEHADVITNLVETAESQLVLACPKIDYSALQTMQNTLREALARKVRIVLVWGSDERDGLDPRVSRMLRDMRAEAGKGSLVCNFRRSSRSNACVVIADDRRALVTGFSFLESHPPRVPRQLGILLTAQEDRDCSALESLLDWVQTAMPDYNDGQLVKVRRRQFLKETGSTTPPEPVVPGGYPEEPPETDDKTAESAFRAWCTAWAVVAGTFRSNLAARTGPWAEIVRDGAHRDVLWRALRQTRRRLTISSDRIGDQSFDIRTAGAIGKRLDDNVKVTMVYARRSGPPAALRTITELIETLRADAPAGSLLVQQRDSNARAIVFDDQALVGSFEPLWGQGAMAAHRARSEIGVRLGGTEITRRIAEVLGAPLPRPETESPRLPVQEVSPGSAECATDAQRLLNSLVRLDHAGPEARAEMIRDRLDELIGRSGPQAAWSVLTYLHGEQVPAEALRIAVAHTLVAAAGTDEFETARWRAWLMARFWREGQYVEAALLRAGASPSPALRPWPGLTLVAATRGTPFMEDALLEAAVSMVDVHTRGAVGGTREELVALTLVCVIEVLLGAYGETAREVLCLIEPALPARPWAEAAALARRQKKALPFDLIRSKMGAQRLGQDAGAAWELLDSRFGRATQVTFRFPSGHHTHTMLFHPDGEFGQLAAPIERRDQEAVARWAQTHPVEGLGVLLDNTSRLALPGKERLIDGSQRRNFLDKLRLIVLAAQHVGTLPATGDDPRTERALTGPHETARQLAALWPRLTAEADAFPEPEGALVRRIIGELEVIARWGRT